MEAAKKYADDYDGMQWEKDRIEIAFIKGAEYSKSMDNGAILAEKIDQYVELVSKLDQQLDELQKQLDLEIRVANAQVEIVKEKDAIIEQLDKTTDVLAASEFKLKEALTRIKNHATLPVEVEREIENLLK